jgi:hypothetical protein
VDRRADLAALDWRLTRPVVAGDQQEYPILSSDRRFEPAVDRLPCLVEIHPVKVENTVRFDCSRAKPPVPSAIERRAGPRRRWRARLRTLQCRRFDDRRARGR